MSESSELLFDTRIRVAGPQEKYAAAEPDWEQLEGQIAELVMEFTAKHHLIWLGDIELR